MYWSPRAKHSGDKAMDLAGTMLETILSFDATPSVKWAKTQNYKENCPSSLTLGRDFKTSPDLF